MNFLLTSNVAGSGVNARRHRALTLLEVLLATMILSLIAISALPLMTQSLALLQPQFVDDSERALQLQDAVDALLIDEQFRKDLARRLDEGDRQFAFELKGIQVRRVNLDEPGKHAWLAFQLGDEIAFRWMELPAVPRTHDGDSP